VTDREAKICAAVREAVGLKPRTLKDVAAFVNGFIMRERLGNPITEAGVAAVVAKFGRATLKLVTRGGESWLQSVEQSLPE
jgi:hypothetical protein